MITHEEYLEALNIVNKYHSQIIKNSEDINKIISFNNEINEKTLITSWLNNNQTSIRLWKILVNFKHKNHNFKQSAKPIIFMQDINRGIFLHQRNAGLKTWEELCLLTKHNPLSDEYIYL